ncbi:MAG: hypothetical protein U1E39_03750 [Planctomycetota bacterium]
MDSPTYFWRSIRANCTPRVAFRRSLSFWFCWIFSASMPCARSDSAPDTVTTCRWSFSSRLLLSSSTMTRPAATSSSVR